MTTTDDTRSQLLAEVAANPEDDTLRLAFADWLDEQPTTRTCPKCGGKGHHYNPPYGAFRPDGCSRCNRRGTVPNASDADRAEFIRTEFSIGHPDWLPLGRTGTLFEREAKLLAAHPEWSRCRCPQCDGTGRDEPDGFQLDTPCPTCSGTGDLFLRHVDDRTHATEPRTVTFARGSPDAVTCTLAEAFGTDGTPTPWAVAVVRQTPVVRFRMADFVPLERLGSGNRFRWWGESPQIGRTIGLRPYILPCSLFAELKGESKDWEHLKPDDFCWEYSTAAAAADALALAAGRVVRRHAYPGRK